MSAMKDAYTQMAEMMEFGFKFETVAETLVRTTGMEYRDALVIVRRTAREEGYTNPKTIEDQQ